MEICLMRSADVGEALMVEVTQLVSAPGNAITIQQINITADTGDGPRTHSELFSVIRSSRAEHSIPDKAIAVLLTATPNTDNWFSAFDDSPQRNIFGYTSDWDYYVPCDAAHAIAYQVIENVLQVLMFDSLADGVEASHDPPIGCLNDMCSWKPDITFKLRTADVCMDCLTRCEARISPVVLEHAFAVMESVRKQALCGASYRRGAPVSNGLPFPVAYTKRKLGMSRDPLRKFLFLIDHFDSLVRTATLMLGRILLDDDFEDFAVEQELSRRPSLGHWVAALQALSVRDTERAGLDLTISAAIQNRFDEIVQRATEDRIVQMRNEQRGHGYIDCHDDTYYDVFRQTQPAVRDIEALLTRVFGAFSLVHVVRDDHLDVNTAKAQVWRLMGDHPDFMMREISYSPDEWGSRPFVNHVYAIPRNGGRWHDLHDSIVHVRCPECEHNRILLSDGEMYLDPYAGHRVRLHEK